MQRLLLICCLILSGCQMIQRQPSAADEKAIRDADIEWSKAAAAKDLEKTLSFYAEDAVVFPPNMALTMGKPSVRVLWTSLMAAPGFAISWAPMKVDVARAGDMAYSFGAYTMTTANLTGHATSDRGKYVVVWKKQTDNTWKAVADIFNSDLPGPAAPPSAPPV